MCGLEPLVIDANTGAIAKTKSSDAFASLYACLDCCNTTIIVRIRMKLYNKYIPLITMTRIMRLTGAIMNIQFWEEYYPGDYDVKSELQRFVYKRAEEEFSRGDIIRDAIKTADDLALHQDYVRKNFIELIGNLLKAIPNSIPKCAPHCEVQIRTVDAALEAALMALVADPVCSHLSVSDIKKMGTELLEANKPYVPNGYLE
jgi:hypothetical protein